jgi:hypothetical protein
LINIISAYIICSRDYRSYLIFKLIINPLFGSKQASFFIIVHRSSFTVHRQSSPQWQARIKQVKEMTKSRFFISVELLQLIHDFEVE